jgi:hypothetical protein
MKHVVCFALCTLVPSLALGQPGDQALPPPSKPVPANLTGLTFAAGVGYGMPFGEIKTQLPGYADQRLGSYIASQVPLTLTAGYRPHPLLSFGVAFQYAFLSAKNCPTGSTCSASDKRVWGEVRFHVIPDRVFSPWISVGGGYEWFDLSETTRVLGSHLDLSGWEADVEVGGDIRATPFLTLGPCLGVRAGRYTFRSLLGTGVTTGYGSRDIDSEDQTTHGWVAFGVRGAFALFPR